MNTFIKGRRTFTEDYLLIGKNSKVLTMTEKVRMFPRANHMPMNKRTITRVCVLGMAEVVNQ